MVKKNDDILSCTIQSSIKHKYGAIDFKVKKLTKIQIINEKKIPIKIENLEKGAFQFFSSNGDELRNRRCCLYKI